jgi:hypothetical protein
MMSRNVVMMVNLALLLQGEKKCKAGAIFGDCNITSFLKVVARVFQSL